MLASNMLNLLPGSFGVVFPVLREPSLSRILRDPRAIPGSADRVIKGRDRYPGLKNSKKPLFSLIRSDIRFKTGMADIMMSGV